MSTTSSKISHESVDSFRVEPFNNPTHDSIAANTTTKNGPNDSKITNDEMPYHVAATKSNDLLSTVNSKAPSLARTITKTVNTIWNAVQDDNEQTNKEMENDELNKLLESRFDVADAFRLHDNTNTSLDNNVNEPLDNTQDTSSILNPDLEKDNAESLHSVPEDLESTPNSIDSLHYKTTHIAGEENQLYEEGSSLEHIEKPETLDKVFTNKSNGQLDLPPDKGYAWVVVFTVFLVMFNTWGCNSAFGVYLSFYLSNDVFVGATKYDYAIIAGLTVALGQGFCPIAMFMLRVIGMKRTMLIGCVFLLAGELLASFSTRLWELYLTQGVMNGISIALIFAPATTVLPGWFLKKRAVAMGISLLGTGAGGVTFGLASQKMITDNGNAHWCYRMLAIVCTVSCLISITFIRERIPSKPVGFHWGKIKLELKRLFDWNVIKKPAVPLITIWFTLALLGYNLMVFTLASYAVARGMSAHQGASLTAILNGSQAIGRPVMGLMGDKIGRANITIILTSVLVVYMFGFWIPAHTYVQMIMFSILVGLCVGVANVMSTVLIADMIKPSEFLPAWAFVNYAGAPVLFCCEVIAQALTVPGTSNPYFHTQLFAGCCFSCALIMICILREICVRSKLNARQEENNRKFMELDDTSSGGGDKINNEECSVPSMEDRTIIEHRREKYNLLLGPGAKKYFLRMTYPMKV